MNIFLIPYNGLRHIQVALVTGGAAVLAWWALLSWVVLGGPGFGAWWDGAFYMLALAASTAGASTWCEGALRRSALHKRALATLIAVGIAGGFALIWYWFWHAVAAPTFFGGMERLLLSIWEGERSLAFPTRDIGDMSLVSLRYRLGAFTMAGSSAALGALFVRRGAGFFEHVGGGLGAGLASALTWYFFSAVHNDMFLASGFGALAFGATFGLLTWGIPDGLYAGWVRVLTSYRFGHRIPIDALEPALKERFIGSYPRGLDLRMGPFDDRHADAVRKLHVSVVVSEEQRYTARGLSVSRTVVRRFLEKLDLRYDPRRPAPLETQLSSGDVIEMGQGEVGATVEFIMLPREDK